MMLPRKDFFQVIPPYQERGQPHSQDIRENNPSSESIVTLRDADEPLPRRRWDM